MDLPKTYNPKGVEEQIYQRWEASGFFNPDNLEKASDRYWKAEVFAMAMPPANVTADLHLGSAMFLTVEDLIIRHARMTGKRTLWLPGTDHAAIATQNVVERQIWEKEKKTRHELGREELLKRIEEFAVKTRRNIQRQIRRLGASCDWSREKYTLSPELSRAVNTAFKQMYERGLIYRGDRIVNWCPRCGTTLADDEVEHEQTEGQLYFIRYPYKDKKGGLTVATTRPETILADTAVAVHPADTRYRKAVGQAVMLPLVNRELTIIADRGVDREFGTGVLKITPGHDPLDFEIGKRHKLEIINLFTPDGKISSQEAYDHGFEDYAGLTAAEARDKIVKVLAEEGFLEKTERIDHGVGHCYRCATTVEPIVSKQWFINVSAKVKVKSEKFKKLLNLKSQASLQEIGMAAIKSGAIKIVPERFGKIYLNWMEILRDWNISRQIWFGHRVPVWYCRDCEEIAVALDAPQTCPACQSSRLEQDTDTLDTWFSSGLWTFSTLGWPEETEDLKTFHPTTILETGYDILFFWVARMILMTGFVLEDIPFRTVYLHGLVRDFQGKKMSKSRGNAINPLEMIEKYGTDALRLSLILGTTPGNDAKINEQKIENYRNFINKLWNISRYVFSSSKSGGPVPVEPKSETLAQEWILNNLRNLAIQVNQHLENYQYGIAGELLYEFTWNKFADWYIEISKISAKNGSASGDDKILLYVLQTLLKLWHPFIPFVTEHLWSQFADSMLMVQDYPKPSEQQKAKSEKAVIQFQKLQTLIGGLRNLRAEYRLPPGEIFACYLTLPKTDAWVKEQVAIIENLSRVKLNLTPLPADKKMPHLLWSNTKAHLIIPNFDPKKEKTIAEKELKETLAKLTGMEQQLRQKDFRQKAPAEVVEKLQTGFATLKLRADRLQEKIKQL